MFGNSVRNIWKLSVIAVLNSVLYIWKLGFYYDDWFCLKFSAGAKTFTALVKAWYYGIECWHRPLQAILGAGTYYLFGTHPLGYHILLGVFNLFVGILLFLWLESIFKSEQSAFAVASLAMIYPVCGALKVWPACMFALTTEIVILLCFLEYQRGNLIVSLGLYLASLLLYDNTYFLPFVAIYAKSGFGRRSVVDASLFGAAGGLIGIWYFWIARHYFNFVSHRGLNVEISWSHVQSVFKNGAFAVTGGPLMYFAVSLVYSTFLMVVMAFIAWALYRVICGDDYVPIDRSKCLRLAGFGFVCAYLPYTLSSQYTPNVFWVMSRVNGCGVWFGALALAALLSRFRMPVYSVLVLFTFCNWSTNYKWGKASDRYHEIMSQKKPVLPISGSWDRHIGDVVIFDSKEELQTALDVSRTIVAKG